ncbi:hypothetical protein GEMRC1_005964 [Eukaryota sp. GEM-RC1]
MELIQHALVPLIGVSDDGDILIASNPFAEVLGFSPDQLKSTPVSSLCQNCVDFQTLLTSLKSGSSYTLHFLDHAHTVFYCEVILLSQHHSLNVLYFKSMSESLQLNLDMAYTIISLANVGYWIMDLKTRKIIWNKSLYDIMEGSSDYQPKFEDVIDCLPVDDRHKVLDLIERSTEFGDDFIYRGKYSPSSFELEHLSHFPSQEVVSQLSVIFDKVFQDGKSVVEIIPCSKDAKTLYYQLKVHPSIFDEQGNVQEITGIVQDLTDLISAKEKLKVQPYLRVDFLAMLVMKLERPSTPSWACVCSLSYLTSVAVLKNQVTDSNQRCLIQEADSSASLLLSLVNNVIDLYRIESNEFTFMMSEFNVITIVDDLTNYFSESFGSSASIEWLTLVDSDAFRSVKSDQHRLLQILVNLIRAVNRFATEGFKYLKLFTYFRFIELRVSTEIPSRDPEPELLIVRFRVTPFGAEVPDPALLELLFNPFELSPNDLSLDYGFGLAVAQGIAKLMGSEVKLVRDEDGSSVYFDLVLTLPCLRGGVSLKNLKGLKIGVLMKESYTRETLFKQLRVFGICVTEISSSMLINNRFDSETNAIFVHAPCLTPAVELVLERTNAVIVNLSFYHRHDEVEARRAFTSKKHSLVLPILYDQLLTVLSSIAGDLLHRRPATVRLSSGGERFKILFADDQHVNRRVMGLLLDQLEVDAECVEDGSIAFDLYKKNPLEYDLIILDYRMPTSGSQTARSIREFERNNGIGSVAIMCLTADASLDSKIDSLDAGMNFWLSKPVTKYELVNVLDQFLPLTRRCVSKMAE